MREKREVSKAQMDRDAIATKIYQAINEADNGGRKASVLINIFKNGEFNETEARSKRIAKGPATARQSKAVFAFLWARRYTLTTYQDALGAVKNREKMERYMSNIRRKEALVFVNATPPERMKAMFCPDTRTESEKQEDAEAIKACFE